MADIKIIVAAHKEYKMPEGDMYLPVHVGAVLSDKDFGYQRDDQGDNISAKNRSFCELTGIYWAWKNLDADYVGLVHYRRLFGKKSGILQKAEAERLLEKSGVVVPALRKYYIENLYSHYVNTLHAGPLDKTYEIIAKKYPEYMPEMDALKKRTSAHMFNMFIMKKEYFDRYCEWMFDVLFELEKNVDDNDFDAFHSRFYGRISELMLDVWLRTNKIDAAECPFVYTEKVNWFKKIKSFLMAKFFKKKYDKSF